MDAPADLPLRERLAHWVEHLTHILPAQAPIRDFVHHNTLHGFQHLPFADALAAAHRLTGATPYLSEARFRDYLAQGRITREDLAAALDDAGIPALDEPIQHGLSRRDVLLASLQCDLQAACPERRKWLADEGMDSDEVAKIAHFLQSTATIAETPAVKGDWRSESGQRRTALWARLGRDLTWCGLLEHLTGEDVLDRVRTVLQRHLAAHLDLGMAAWRNPLRERGFYAAWRACAGLDMAWELDELPSVRDEIAWLPEDAVDLLAEELPRLIPDETLWPGYLECLALELPGWSGMVLWRDRHALSGDDMPPVAVADYLAVRVLLERLLVDDLLRRLTGGPTPCASLHDWFADRPAEFFVRDALRQRTLDEETLSAALRLCRLGEAAHPDDGAWQTLAERIGPSPDSPLDRARLVVLLAGPLGARPADLAAWPATVVDALLACATSLDALTRGQVWLLAYERHYREQLLVALAANQGRHRGAAAPSAQVVMCMDDREEGTRRHLEEIAPDIETFGAAGFFGVAMYWQAAGDAGRTALCPIVVQPVHVVEEIAAPGEDDALRHQLLRRQQRAQWREALVQQTRRSPVLGPLFAGLAAVPALGALVAGSLAPAWWGDALLRWRERRDGMPTTRVAMTAEAAAVAPTPQAPQAGFTDDEQAARVAAFLRMIGLTRNFAPLVLMLGHGSDSRNNPHRSAYDCGACSGRHGGPNARVFAAMANRPAVRARLAAQGLAIPETTWFVAAQHNTCDDAVHWYDVDLVPPARQADFDTLVAQLAEACRAHAAERCRRLASAPPHPTPWQARRHVTGRLHDISQARPELGHATNAAAFIGRRSMSRGLFLDRRVFLISYDPTEDPEGRIVEGILLAAGPVGAGISLEYYFSTVDNDRFGCGSKITHNLTGGFGVMAGAESDLRTGLPWQMVEIHEAMRLLVVVEQAPDVLSAIVARQPALQELVGNGWINLAAKDPSTATISVYCPRRGWLPWSGPHVLPQVGRSVDWFAGERDALTPALVLGGVA